MLRQDAAVRKRDLGGAVDGHPASGGVPIGDEAAGLHHHCGEALHLEVLPPRIGRGLEGGVGVAFDGGERAGEIGAHLLEGKNFAAARRVAAGDDGKALDIDLDRFQRILGQGLRVGDHHRDRFAHVTDLALRDHGLFEARELGHRLLPQRNLRHRFADLARRVITACMPGRARAAVQSIERMRPCATELRRMAACRSPGRVTSSTYSPRPRKKRRSSRRSTGLPMNTLPGRGCATDAISIHPRVRRLPAAPRQRLTSHRCW